MHTRAVAALIIVGCALTDASASLVTYRIEGRVQSIEYLTDGYFGDIGLGASVSIDLVFDDQAAPISTEGATSTWGYATASSRFTLGNHSYIPEDLDGWNSYSFTNAPVNSNANDRLNLGGQILEKDAPGNFFVQIDLPADFVLSDGAVYQPPLIDAVIDPVSSKGHFNLGNPSSGVALGWEVLSIHRVPTPSGLSLASLGCVLSTRRRR